MHLHFERTANAKSDCSILSLTWMGKVPDELPEDEGWKLNRTNYYQEGWLATGNIRGIVGVTFTTSHCKKNVDFPLRTNYNLRGHRSEVILVKWNEPYQKLASCDSSGIIFVWIKYEGRWSIELINDRNTPVTHFSWSHDGRMALICYQDGFVLVGSVAGQRYWSSMLNLDATITCGIWTPDDQQVYFGTTAGQIIVMDVHGAMVSQVQLGIDVGITTMAWSCEKFKMEEGEDGDVGVSNANERRFVLAVCLQNGLIFLLKTFDDLSPIQIETGMQGPIAIEWSNSRELLAVAGVAVVDKLANPTADYLNLLKFYNEKGVLLHSVMVPYNQAPISALTWGHNDKRLFLATGTQIHIAWVSRRIATLQLMSRLKIHDAIENEMKLFALPLPARIRNLIGNLFAQTIRCCVPETSALRDFVSRPPYGSVRLHCTMIRHDDDNNLSSGTCYTLYLEYLGGLVPLLKGKRTSKIRPEFVIFDPQIEDFHLNGWSSESKSSGPGTDDTSDSEREDGCASSPRMQRRRRHYHHHYRRNPQSQSSTTSASSPQQQSPQPQTNSIVITPQPDNEDLAYVDTLPEHVRLVEVTSNIWGTKFKIHGLVNSVPANLGQVTYKTSLLHLQPRQMTLVMTELRDDFPVLPDPTFNPNLFSEDEEDNERSSNGMDLCPPIAPMSPRISKSSRNGRPQDDDDGDGNRMVAPTSTSFVGRGTTAATPTTILPSFTCDGAAPALQSPKNAVAPSHMLSLKKDDDVMAGPSAINTSHANPAINPSICLADSMVRSCSVGYLDMVDAQLVPRDVVLLMLRKDNAPKRLILVNRKSKTKRQSRRCDNTKIFHHSVKLKNYGKSKSLDSSDIFPSTHHHNNNSNNNTSFNDELKNEQIVIPLIKTNQDDVKQKKESRMGFFTTKSPLMRRKKNDNLSKNHSNHMTDNGSTPLHTQALANLEKLITRLREDDKSGTSSNTITSTPTRLPRSSPASPAPTKKGKRPQSASPIRKNLLSSPLLGRKNRKYKNCTESSDDEIVVSGDEVCNGRNYRDLETFQKAQLRQKLKRGKIEPNGNSNCNNHHLIPQRREFVMHNKAPMWNENSQVYQLDFGGRVTQESAKNFQIEFRGKQVMQFGRIDGNAYTLDFQYPFSALQAFAVALANVTQRLK